MDVKHINAVCRATKSILSSHFGVDVTLLNPKAQQQSVPSNDVSVVLGVNGELSGQIICSITEDTAKNIVGVMMGGMVIEKLDEMGWSAIQEFGNWVAGSTATELSKENCIIDVTPPMVNEKESVYRTTKMFITVPLDSKLGLIDVHISLSDKAS
ncbi:chemotaxis protein CheX [Evansella cellulosilytica]|uniref:CheC domain protein n=1 Tax=Evansella cellulosilytica (strain ATCC 21833 / DSM 2522 / FERM P-1141 / JCM 9156 / N-4) TaxID=649639 RepID=E6TTL0_EVAC2|nr:chemotaxis protein CheC [Evansella cellulosilytica]ADU29646.1 CheC domain protein [Evansella cellulosilytica DSM 2522]